MRKSILILLLMMLTGTALAEEAVCVSMEGITALLAPDGREIVAPGQYADAFSVSDGELYALGLEKEEGMRYALCDAEGQVLTKFLYTMFRLSGDAVVFRQDGLYGAMDRGGNLLLEANYTQLVTEDGIHFLAMKSDPFDDEPDQLYRVTADGGDEALNVSSNQGLRPLSDDRMAFQNRSAGLFGYMNGRGETVIKAALSAAGDFHGGIARASMDEKLGIIDADGCWKIEPKYDYLEEGDGVIVGLIGRKIFEFYRREDFRKIVTVEGEALSAAVVGAHPVLYRDGKLIVYSADGSVWMETEEFVTLTEGLDGQMVLSARSWGAKGVSVLTAQGEPSERKDQHVLPLSDGRYAFIRMDAAEYYSDALGEVRYSCNYDSMRWGMMDAAGNEILPAEYLEIRALGSGRFLAVSQEHLEMTDADGNRLWQCERANADE